MLNKIAKKTTQLVFVKLETVSGTLVYPASVDSTPTVGRIQASQTPGYTNSPEIQDSRGVKSRFQDGFPAGDFTIELVPRLNAAGTAPVAAPLFESLMGTKTVNAGVSVGYTQADARPSFSLCYRQGHAVHWVSGAKVAEAKISLSDKKGPVQISFTGKFLKEITAGDDQVAVLVVAAQAVVGVSEAKRFMVGARVYNPACAANGGAADDNAAVGYEVLAVDTALNQLILAANVGFDWTVDEEVRGFLPAGQTVGTPLEKRHAVVTFGGVEGAVTAFEVTLSDAVQPIENEITSSPYPTESVEGERKVSGSYKVYFRRERSDELIAANAGAERAVVLTLGETRKLTLTLPRVPLEVAKVEEDGPVLVLANQFEALETNGDDSASLSFT